MIWYPYTQMKNMKTPYEIVKAEGVYLCTKDKKLIDDDSLKVCEAITGLKVIACVRDNDEEINFAGGITL
ncbi:MAG: hypothetical protein IJS28_09680 [Synergistaceae bacterium]|nr:hypothetical protein [Synergistaceae bacterium]